MLPGHIFICDDEEEILRYLGKILASQGYAVETFTSGTALLKRLHEPGKEPELLLQDVRMPDMDGITVLNRVRMLRPELPVIIMTAFGAIDDAVAAIRLGAYDYLTKPFPKEKLLTVMGNALEQRRLRNENRELRGELGRAPTTSPIIFRSARFRELYDLTVQVADSDANVLITGESGTGKELIAAAVHTHSPRQNRPLLSINCSALTDTLLESQLFGHLRGAFTGAVSTRKGLLEEAGGGTLFLDEVGDMSPPLQAKLLRVIQSREFLPVGATRPSHVDIRFVAATNKDLETEISLGRFREDLYYRLNVISLHLPPLRERREDVAPLARHFLDRFARRMNRGITGISQEALAALEAHSWPGNVRELENVMERGVILTRGNEIQPGVLPLKLTTPPTEPVTADSDLSLESVEMDHIRQVLHRTGFHKSHSAEILGISRKTLDRKIAQYRIRG
jgi:DNA-binding NtrC family response regulator